jgi:uncharacterized protein (TIGR01777 family)
MTPTGRVVIAGGTGFLGASLARYLVSLGCDVVALSRHEPRGRLAWQHARWDARTLGPWVERLEHASAVVNLAGRTVDCVKTPDHCDEILRSRVESTLVLGQAFGQLDDPPPVWVQMSTAHRYGDPPTEWCSEDSPFGYGLAPFVGAAWEAALEQSAPPTVRTVVLRTSFVLGRTGGALDRLATLTRFGLGGTVGSGRQGISWIHVLDMNRLFARAISDERMRGAYIATAPNPVPNAEFMRELRRAIGMPVGLPAMSWMVRAAAPLLRTDPELALYGRYCFSRRLRNEGFEFQFPTVREALADLYGGA